MPGSGPSPSTSHDKRLGRWRFGCTGASWIMEPRPKSKEIPKKAVKCDMCKDLPGGAACVRACPTGAAVRVSPEQFLNYAGSE